MTQIAEIPLIRALKDFIEPEESLHLVGGAIRNAILGLAIFDLDFTCFHGIKTGKRVADHFGFGFFILDREHDTCRVIETLPTGVHAHYDFAGFRGRDIFEDLRGRDLTINAIGYDICKDEIVDPLGGILAVREKRLEACSANAMKDDPIRILRTIRFANTLEFRIGSELLSQVQANAAYLGEVSRERVRDEVMKILSGRKPHIALQLMERVGILGEVFPELIALKDQSQSIPPVHNVWEHTLSVVRHLSDIIHLTAEPYDESAANSDIQSGLLVLKLGKFRGELIKYFSKRIVDERDLTALLILAALFHDVEKPYTAVESEDGRLRFLGHDALGAVRIHDRMTEFKFSGKEIDRISAVIRYHMRFHALVSRRDAGKEINDRSIYRFFGKTEQVGLELILLGLADMRGTYEHTLSSERWRSALDVAETLIDTYVNRYYEVVEPKMLLSGNDLIEILGMEPGPEIGKVLDFLREEQAAKGLNDRNIALKLVSDYIERDTGV